MTDENINDTVDKEEESDLGPAEEDAEEDTEDGSFDSAEEEDLY